MTATPDTKRLVLLGGAVVRENGNPLGGPAAHRHRLALLALLAANASPVSRDKLIAMLWPERDTEGGRNLLKVAVHELRKLLGEQTIRTTGDQLSLGPAALPCDLLEFEAALAAGAEEKAVAVYGGPFLDGFYLKDAPEFERWVEAQRNRLATAYSGALEKLGATAERSNDWRNAVQWWRKLAAEDPMRADNTLRLMRALDASGDRRAALRQAELHAERRQRDFGVAPDPAVESLAKELGAKETPSADTGVKRPAKPAKSRATPPAEMDHVSGERVVTVRGLSRRAVMGAGVALVLTIAAVVVIGTVVNHRASDAPSGTDAVAVVPFRVVGADSSLGYLRDGMMEMLVTRLGTDGPLRAVEARSGASADAADQLPIAMQQGRALGAGHVLVGDVVGGRGKDVDVSATIYRVASGEMIGRATRTITDSASIPATIDSLAAELMARAAGEPLDRLPDLTRRPLPALRSYLAAQVSYRTGGYARAESLFAKALGLDSSFALAGLGLVLANSWTTINEHYGIGRDAALRGMKTLGQRDRLFINAFFAPDPSLGQPRPAPVYLQAWEDVVHKYPDFAEAWYHVGDRYYHFGGLSGLADPLDQARTAFRRALAIDSGMVAPLHHLIEIYASRGEANETRVTADRYFAENPGVSRDASAIGWTVATITGDEKWLARLRGNFGTMPLSDLARVAWTTQANGWPSADADSALALYRRRASATFEREAAFNVLYAFSLNAGRPAAARQAAAGFEAQLPDQPITALWTTYAMLFGEADTVGLGENGRRLAAFGSAPLDGNPDHRARQFQSRCLSGFLKLQGGNSAGAREDLAAVRRLSAGEPAGSFQLREGMMCSTWLGAAIAVDARASDAATLVARLDTVVLRDRVPPRMSLAAAAVIAARLHDKRGDLTGALIASRWREHYTGDPTFLSTQLLLEGDLALRTGDRASAVRAYRHYLALRTTPEPGFAAAATDAVRKKLVGLEKRD